MNKPTPIRETLDLLRELRGVLEDFAAREERLSDAGKRRRARDEAADHEAAAAAAAEAAATRETLDRDFAEHQARHRARHQARTARITRAARTLRKRHQQAAEQIEGRGKFTLQKGLLDAARTRDAGLESARKEAAEFENQMAQTRDAFHQMEAEVRQAFQFIPGFSRLLAPGPSAQAAPADGDDHALRDRLFDLHEAARAELDRFRHSAAAVVFRWLHPAMVLPVLAAAIAGAPWLLARSGLSTPGPDQARLALAVAGILAVLIESATWWRARPAARRIADALARFPALHSEALEKSNRRRDESIEQIQADNAARVQSLNDAWWKCEAEAETLRQSSLQQLDQAIARATRAADLHLARTLERLERERHAALERWDIEERERRTRLSEGGRERRVRTDGEDAAQWDALMASWRLETARLFSRLESAAAALPRVAPSWGLQDRSGSSVAPAASPVVGFGRIDVQLQGLASRLPRDPRLALPGPAAWSLPLALSAPNEANLLLETGIAAAPAATATLNAAALRFLQAIPPGRLTLTILDPSGLGQHFPALAHLADYEESRIHDRIWTQPAHIETKLAELNDHMEKVIQMYLRNEFETIDDYNRQAGALAEKYHLVVLAGFPTNFTETAVRRLLNIVASGGRCGIFTLIHWDNRNPIPPGSAALQLRDHCIALADRDGRFEMAGPLLPGATIRLDSPPDSTVTTELLHRIGRESRTAGRVEVPFEDIAPADDTLWSEETSSELRVPIGRTRATRFQYLALGKGTQQHVLIAGKTGSGKSTLFHVIITNLALRCSPDQVEFYLVDFKKGVEFKPYATHHLPHARVVAIESDREFGLSVLERVDEELRRRGEIFRKLGVQDLPGYHRTPHAPPLPRCLLMIDEFQEFFVEEDRTSQAAGVLLDRIVRQGRAFGIHVLLGSQTLGGAFTLARATLGQMVVRIALQCNEADAHLIMDDTNSAPRLLSRPGEGIYNPMAGALEGNSPFQTAWLSEETRAAALRRIRDRARASHTTRPQPVVFEGNVPADVDSNPLLARHLETPETHAPAAPTLWLGAPNAIKEPTHVTFHHQSRANLLVVGHHDEAGHTLLLLSILALATQHPAGTARYLIVDTSPPGTPEHHHLGRLLDALGPSARRTAHADLGPLLEGLHLTATTPDNPPAPIATYLFIHSLQNLPRLKPDDDFAFGSSSTGDIKPSALFQALLAEGPPRGIHTVAFCDTFNNVNRFLGRRGLAEFDFRILFQMSATDSSSLIDGTDAASLGLHRALLYNDREGRTEKFRPYAPPPDSWLEQALNTLARRHGQAMDSAPAT